MRLPTGIQRPSEIVADPADGVWFWTQDSTQTLLIHVTDARQVKTYPLGNPAQDGLRAGLLTPIAIGPHGGVWIGSGKTLSEFDPATGATKFWTVPLVTSTDGSRANFAAISDIAVTRQGKVAVTGTFARGVPVLDPATGAFTTIGISGKGAPTSVSALSDGTLAIGLANVDGAGGSIEWVSPSGQTSATSISGIHLSADGDRVLIANGNLSRAAPGADTPLTIARGTPAAVNSNGLDFNAPVAVAANGTLVASTNSGLAILGPTGSPEDALVLPRFNCAGMSGNMQASESPGRTCAQLAEGIAVDNKGSVFFFTSGPKLVLQEIPASTNIATVTK